MFSRKEELFDYNIDGAKLMQTDQMSTPWSLKTSIVTKIMRSVSHSERIYQER
jgi:hypothetical protein